MPGRPSFQLKPMDPPPTAKVTAPDGLTLLFRESVSQSGNICRRGYQPIRGYIRCRSSLSLSIEANGSATYLTKVTAPDGAGDWFGYPFPSRAIFLPSGLSPTGGISDTGATYLYQVEANGSASYLTKVTAPDGADTIIRKFRFPAGNILAVGAISRPGGIFRAGAAYLYQLEANGSATYPTKVTAPMEPPTIDSDPWFPSRAIFRPPGLQSRSGVLLMPGQSIPLIFQPYQFKQSTYGFKYFHHPDCSGKSANWYNRGFLHCHGSGCKYHFFLLLVAGAGDGNNSLFTLETNGTLKLPHLDYEAGTTFYPCKSKDENNASIDGNLPSK